MKPTKNHYYCPACQHQKMLFARKKEALLFLKHNARSIEEQTGKRPVRAYYCTHCCGWHLTSKPNSHGRVDLIKRYGVEAGQKMYDTILPLISRGASISGSITKKLKNLRHNLKYEVIDGAKCRVLIDELFDIFEVIIGAQLEDKATVDSLFSKFSRLCNIFDTKKFQKEIA